jgi:hypothetical protein
VITSTATCAPICDGCGMAFVSAPLCPRCDREMRRAPSVGQRTVFLCVACGHVETREQSDGAACDVVGIWGGAFSVT